MKSITKEDIVKEFNPPSQNDDSGCKKLAIAVIEQSLKDYYSKNVKTFNEAKSFFFDSGSWGAMRKMWFEIAGWDELCVQNELQKG